MFKRTEEQEWTRFSKALSSKDKEESHETQALEAESAPEPVATVAESEAAVAEAPVTPPSAPAPVIPPLPAARPVGNDVNVSVSRVSQPPLRTSSSLAGDVQTVVGPQTSFNGTLRSDTSIRILGSVEGEVYSQQAVMVEEQATVKARISAESITVAGQVTGEIQCAGRVEILPSGRVNGEIQAGTLVMQEGAFFEGHLKMGGDALVEPAPAPMAAPSDAAASRSRR